MFRGTYKTLSLILATLFFVTGCATTRAKKADPAMDSGAQIQELQREVEDRDKQIQELQDQLDSLQQGSSFSSSNSASRQKSSVIRVSGVSAVEVQRALLRAGFDPGPIDGRIGRKTKNAIRQFQRSQGLHADGVIGSKTWSRLKQS